MGAATPTSACAQAQSTVCRESFSSCEDPAPPRTELRGELLTMYTGVSGFVTRGEVTGLAPCGIKRGNAW